MDKSSTLSLPSVHVEVDGSRGPHALRLNVQAVRRVGEEGDAYRLTQPVDVGEVGAGADLDEEAGARVAVDAQPHAHAMERSLWASALGDFPSTQAARLLRRT